MAGRKVWTKAETLELMTKSNKRDTCRPLFKKLGILPLPSQYIFSLLLFVVTNKNLFSLYSQIHGIYFFDVWLTVHRSSMWIKRPTRCHF